MVFAGAVADSLYVADTAANTVERFDATTGAALGTFIKGNKSLQGPRGLVFDGDGHLLLANQNEGRGKPGEIMKYDANTGEFDGELVPFQNPDTPFAPRGIVLKDGILYVASLQEASTTKQGIAPDGRVSRYDASTGEFLGDLDPPDLPGQFNPRGIVFGPDGKLYVSVFDSSNLAAGHIIQFDLVAGTSQVFATNNGDNIPDPGESPDLHRPEGLTFGPDGELYVTSFRVNANDTDKILIVDDATGVQKDFIQLDEVGKPRAFAQAILFGPDDKLYVPIAGNGPDTGAVRQYDVTTKEYRNFLAPGTLQSPWYLTFGQTNPATLAYEPIVVATAVASLPTNPIEGSATVAVVATPNSTPGMAVLSVKPTSPVATSTASLNSTTQPTTNAKSIAVDRALAELASLNRFDELILELSLIL